MSGSATKLRQPSQCMVRIQLWETVYFFETNKRSLISRTEIQTTRWISLSERGKGEDKQEVCLTELGVSSECIVRTGLGDFSETDFPTPNFPKQIFPHQICRQTHFPNHIFWQQIFRKTYFSTIKIILVSSEKTVTQLYSYKGIIRTVDKANIWCLFSLAMLVYDRCL